MRIRSKAKTQSQAPFGYFVNRETSQWESDDGPFYLHRIVKSKVPLEPGTSVLVSITPVADPKQPAPIRAKAGRRKQLPRGT